MFKSLSEVSENIMRGFLFDNQNLLEKTLFCMHASLPRFVFISAIHPAILGRCAKKLLKSVLHVSKIYEQTQAQPSHKELPSHTNYPLSYICEAKTYPLAPIWYIERNLRFFSCRKMRARDASKYHVQLSIAIFLMLLVFVSGVDQTSRYGGCVLVSVLIHYFSLAAVMWMGAEAVLMFHKLVFVFKRVTKRGIIITSIICWSKCSHWSLSLLA